MISVLGILALVASLVIKEEENKMQLMNIGLVFGVPNMASTVLFCFSRKKLALVDLVTPVHLLVLMLMLILLNSNLLGSRSNNHQRMLQVAYFAM